MSDLKARLPFNALGQSSGFRSDARFSPVPAGSAPPVQAAEDPIAAAWMDGFAAGADEERAAAEDRARAEAQAREALSLGFARLDRDLTETLQQRLRDTVAALCEAALTPLTLDEAALASRIDRALALFQRAEDQRTIRLNPDDVALISDRMATDWHVVPDPALERGALRIETASGGVEDGPAQWRQAIAEALL